MTLSVHTDHDFSTYDLDAPLGARRGLRHPGPLRCRPAAGERDNLDLRDMGELYARGVLLPQFVGTAVDIVDQIEGRLPQRRGRRLHPLGGRLGIL